MNIRPFHVNVPEAELTELRRRINATRWPERELVNDISQGVQLATIQKLARYWATDYDWRKVEAKLNALPCLHHQYLRGGNVVPRANMSDGLLDLIIMRSSGSFNTLVKIVRLKGNSQYIEDENILYYQGSQVLLISKEMDVIVTLDGEPVGILPAIFKVYQTALLLIRPGASFITVDR